MLYNDAKKLHSNDQIVIKSTREITGVIRADVYEKNVYIFAMTEKGYTKLSHKDIK